MTHRLVETLSTGTNPLLQFVSTTCRNTLTGTRLVGCILHHFSDRRERQPGDNETAAIYLHGIESHAGWFDMAAPMLVERGIDIFALDRRGSGLNRGQSEQPDGHATSIDEVLQDVKQLLDLVRRDYSRVILVGLSWGGKPALTLSLRHPALIDGLVLITPGLKTLIDVPIQTRIKILLQSVLMPKGKTTIPIRPEMFTTTPEHLSFIREDPLRLHRATARFFMVSRAFEKEIDATIDSLEVPTLLILAGKDQIIDNQAVLALLESTKDGRVRTLTYDDQTHSIQFDDPERLSTDIGEWVGDLIVQTESDDA